MNTDRIGPGFFFLTDPIVKSNRILIHSYVIFNNFAMQLIELAHNL